MLSGLGIKADANALLRMLANLMSDELLGEISKADYKWKSDKHLVALEKIRDEGKVESPLDWYPAEVLSLISYSEPDDLAWRSGRGGAEGHMIRAFSCAALLRASCDPENEFLQDGENGTLAALILSAEQLGPDYIDATIPFLVWCLENSEETTIPIEERPFFLIGLLFVGLISQIGFRENDLIEIAQALFDVEKAARDEWGGADGDETWLLGNTFFDLRHDAWRDIGQRISKKSGSYDSEPLRKYLAEIGTRLKKNED